jgi:hypothetical protein
MQNARAKALIVTSYCGLILLVEPETVTYALCSCAKIDSSLMEQSESLMELSCHAALPGVVLEDLSFPPSFGFI